MYRGLAGDLNPLHADHEHASQSPIGLSVPAALLAATAIGLGSVDAPVPATIALVGMTWKFIKPVPVGESVAARWRLYRKRDVENPRWGLASWQVDILGGDGEIRATGEISRLVARRVPAAADEQAVPRSRRRRRRSSSAGAAAPTPEAAAEVPEPAPADTPPPARRRRRRRSGSGGGSGNGNGGGAAHGAEPAPASEATPAPEPPAAEPAAAGPETAGIGRVLRRIRRG